MNGRDRLKRVNLQERYDYLIYQFAQQIKVRAAIDRLRRAGLVAKTSTRGTVIDDPLLADHLRAMNPPAQA